MRWCARAVAATVVVAEAAVVVGIIFFWWLPRASSIKKCYIHLKPLM